MREIVNKQKAPKDTVLNNIMKEINEENGVIVDVPTKRNKKTVLSKKKKRSWLRYFFNFMLIGIVLLVLFVIYIITIASTEKTSTKPVDTSSPQKIIVPIKVNKPIKKSIINITLPEKKPIKILGVKNEQKIKNTPHTNDLPLSEELQEARIRAQAKAALMEQMRN